MMPDWQSEVARSDEEREDLPARPSPTPSQADADEDIPWDPDRGVPEDFEEGNGEVGDEDVSD